MYCPFQRETIPRKPSASSLPDFKILLTFFLFCKMFRKKILKLSETVIKKVLQKSLTITIKNFFVRLEFD